MIDAADLDSIVVDKREAWRASDAKARRRQRRYKHLLTRELIKQFPAQAEQCLKTMTPSHWTIDGTVL